MEYFREVLGVEPWTRQAEVLRAVAAHPRVAVRSGHKIGKSISAAGIALWWYETRPRALVVFTSSTDDQIRLILWPEMQRLVRGSRRPIAGTLHESHRSGLTNRDGRKVVGISTNRTENMGGFSGAELLFIVDEASGVDDAIFDAIEGNRAGGARVVMFGNPTQNSGRFYDAFHDDGEFWHPLHVSSEEAAEYQEKVRAIPGLATQVWVDEKRREWPSGSPKWASYQIRVRGEFASQGADSVIPLGSVQAAERRWAEAKALLDGMNGSSPPLEFGVDVARFGDDDTVIWPRRGLVLLQPLVLSSLDTQEIAGRILAEAKKMRHEGERPRVKIDVIGIGAGVYDALRHSREVEAVAVNVAEAPSSQPGPHEPGYEKLRDQLWFGLADFLGQPGAALPPIARARAELVAPRYKFSPRGNYKVESKDEIKARLHRSPDLADAAALAVYSPPRPVARVLSGSLFDL